MRNSESSVKSLGHTISAEGVPTDPEKEQAITNFPTPCKTKDVWALGIIDGLHPSMLRSSNQLELLRKNMCRKWEEKHEKAFNEVKLILL